MVTSEKLIDILLFCNELYQNSEQISRAELLDVNLGNYYFDLSHTDWDILYHVKGVELDVSEDSSLLIYNVDLSYFERDEYVEDNNNSSSTIYLDMNDLTDCDFIVDMDLNYVGLDIGYKVVSDNNFNGTDKISYMYPCRYGTGDKDSNVVIFDIDIKHGHHDFVMVGSSSLYTVLGMYTLKHFYNSKITCDRCLLLYNEYEILQKHNIKLNCLAHNYIISLVDFTEESAEQFINIFDYKHYHTDINLSIYIFLIESKTDDLHSWMLNNMMELKYRNIRTRLDIYLFEIVEQDIHFVEEYYVQGSYKKYRSLSISLFKEYDCFK